MKNNFIWVNEPKLTEEEIKEIEREAYEQDYFKKCYEYYKQNYPWFYEKLIAFDELVMKKHNKLIFELDNATFDKYVKDHHKLIRRCMKEYKNGKKI